MTAPNPEQGLFEALQLIGAKAKPLPANSAHLPDPTEITEDVDKEVEERQKDGTPPPPRITLQNIFRHPDAHPIVLDLILLRRYGPEWLDWEPETIEVAIPHDFPTGNVSDLNLSKINACKTLHLVDSFWQRWEVFDWVTMSLNGVFPDFTMMQVPTVAQMLVSVDIANRIRVDTAWSLEVQEFMKTVYHNDGILVPVPPIDFFTIDTDAVDTKDIDAKWPDVRAQNKAPIGETITNEQLRRMLLVTQYLEESRSRLHNQMELVPHV